MDFSADAWLCPPLPPTVFEEAADDVRHAIDPMPCPSLFTEMCEEDFDARPKREVADIAKESASESRHRPQFYPQSSSFQSTLTAGSSRSPHKQIGNIAGLCC